MIGCCVTVSLLATRVLVQIVWWHAGQKMFVHEGSMLATRFVEQKG